MEYNITYRQKDKGWQYIISAKIQNKWKQLKSKQGFKTKKDAKPVAESAVEELKKNSKFNNSYKVNSDIIFKDVTASFVKHNELYREYNTIQGYKCSISVFDELKDITFEKIKKVDIQNIIDDLLRKGRKVSTINVYIQRLKLIFAYYQETFNCNYDYNFLNFKLPKGEYKSNKKALTTLELENLLKGLETDNYYIVALIAATCGLRCGEILGLTWNDIDFKSALMDINKQWKFDKKTKKHCFGTLKSKNSYRTVPIPKKTLKKLKIYKEEGLTDLSNRLFTCNNSSVEKYLNESLKKIANMPMTIHELRHTYATRLISNGVDFKTAAKLLGHDVKQTLNTYSHVTDEMLESAYKTISKIF